jgi:hypothetical protein
VLGAEVPDLDQTPCPVCDDPIPADEVVWDPYQGRDPRLAALPYHRRCAGDVLPPAEPDAEMRRCAICKVELVGEEWITAWAALHARFETAQVASTGMPAVVWRVASRDPSRAYVPEHFACLMDKLGLQKLPGLPPKS